MTSSTRTSDSTPNNAWAAFVRAAPAGLALVPVGLLFGVLAAQANWNALEVLLFSMLGFSGSGQFALLPLAGQGMGFLTLLLVAVSINSRYVPIAFIAASRLPRVPVRRVLLAHLLGDEAYAVERDHDASVSVLAIRLTIYGAWVLSTVAGVLAAGLLPRSLPGGINLGFPGSVVLLALSFGQLKARVPRIAAPWHRRLVEIGLCITAAILLFAWLGPVWFWLPSIAFSSWRLWRAGA
ncbi:MAG: AzlC family ABC transporter permease [Desulfovibrionaceae bacterium]|jgi:predicted branched-subunit amino acid permease|nr:AzlC family ABC transporter permease [Desulfovibrionaceae bacterium]